MANATAAREDDRQDGVLVLYPVKTASKIYKGTLVSVDSTGYAKRAAAADKRVVGVAYETVDNTGANGALNIRVWATGSFTFATTGATQANVGDAVYVTDDQTVQTSATSTIKVGVINEFVSATEVRVAITPNA